MTEQEQIRAIAELDGWKSQPDKFYLDKLAWLNAAKPDNGGRCSTVDLPPYLTSLDAILNVIEKQETCIKTRMETFLEELQMDWIWLRISPARLCEALLRATGKWKP